MRPWSAYDLTAYMRTSAVRRCWPRTESRLYAEPKNLVHHGLVEASKQYTGKRSRTVYSITKAGTEALTRWLGERPERWETEDELPAQDDPFGPRHAGPAPRDDPVRDGGDCWIGWKWSWISPGGLSPAGRASPSACTSRRSTRDMAIRLGRQRYDFLKWAAEWVSTWDDTQLEGKEEEASRVIAECRAELEQLDAEVRETLGRGPRDTDRSQRRRPGGGGRDEMKGGV